MLIGARRLTGRTCILSLTPPCVESLRTHIVNPFGFFSKFGSLIGDLFKALLGVSRSGIRAVG
jgi:hypothetical protein